MAKTAQSKIVIFHSYDYPLKEARKLISEAGITELPIDPFYLIKYLKVNLFTFSETEEVFPEKIKKFRSFKLEAVVARTPGTENYYIVYDDKVSPDRLRFTLCHEIGHIRLGHVSAFSDECARRGGSCKDPVEKEADKFAAELLRPPVLCALLGWDKSSDIHTFCRVSHQSATICSEWIAKTKSYFHKTYKSEIQFYLQQFHAFIHRKCCKKCSYTFVIPNAKYCPICGSNFLYWDKGVSKVFYEGCTHIKRCPICDNEEISSDAKFCMICGWSLSNICLGHSTDIFDTDSFEEDGCRKPVPPNARFCPYCGKETAFYHYGLLKFWNQEKQFRDVFPPDEEIPF